MQPGKSMILRREATWVYRQQEAFLNWVNHRLSQSGFPTIDSFTEGPLRTRALCNLLEAVSGEAITDKTHEPAKNKYEEIENINAAIKFMKDHGIRMENISAEDVWDGAPRRHIILGLIWLIILHWQINIFDGGKDALLEWVRNQCAPFGVPVENWNKTFMDGRVFGALVASLTDGIDFDNDIKDDDRVGNMKLAFAVADEDLQIPPILSADDEHIGTRDGEKQVMTYCAMFMDKYGSGQKIPPRPADGKQCFAYGPGLESGKNHAEQRCKFTVQCVSPQGKNKKTGGDDVEVTVKDGAGNDLSQVDVKDNGDGTYSVSYLPQQKGAHVVDVRVNGDEIKENPFNVDILRRWTPTVAGMSIAYGPGLETGKVNEEREFTVEARDKDGERVWMGGDEIDVDAVDGKGNAIPVVITDNEDGTYTCRYNCKDAGNLTITPKLNDENVKDAPFAVRINRRAFASKIRAVGKGNRISAADPTQSLAYGPGIDGKTATRFPQPFTVELRDASGNRLVKGGDPVTVDITNPDGSTQQGRVQDNKDGTYTVTYDVPKLGDYVIEPKVDGQTICQKTKNYYPLGNVAYVEAKGPGLERGVLDAPAMFTIRVEDVDGKDVHIEDSRLRLVVKDGTGVEIDHTIVANTEKMLYDCNYVPEMLGPHRIEVYVDNKLVAGPFVAEIGESDVDRFNMGRGDEVTIRNPNVTVGLGWINKNPKRKVDLDTSVAVLRHHRKFDHVYFNERKSLDGAIIHSGDVLSGKKTGDLETIKINLHRVDPKATTLLVACTCWSKDRDFSDVKEAYIRLFDPQSNEELCRYTLSDIGPVGGLLMCQLYRTRPSEWRMAAIGKTGEGRVFDKLLVKEMIGEFLLPAPPVKTVEVRVTRAKGFRGANEKSDSSDVFAAVKFDSDLAKTRVIKDTTDANFEQSLRLKGQSNVVEVSVWHAGQKQAGVASAAAHYHVGDLTKGIYRRTVERTGVPDVAKKAPAPLKSIHGAVTGAGQAVLDTGKKAAAAPMDVLPVGGALMAAGVVKEHDEFLGMAEVVIPFIDGQPQDVPARWYNLKSRNNTEDGPVMGKIQLAVIGIRDLTRKSTTALEAGELDLLEKGNKQSDSLKE